MTHQRDHEYDLHRSLDDVTPDSSPPGRTSKSAGLTGSASPIASGIVLRKQRDNNGVASGADAAVAEAASSAGSPLPEMIQRKFESSLGTDLSGVRVHTGGASETAANAVGARAYAVGQDIHFGAGQYNPMSSHGEHLLAHEVAHTVQQRGGSSTRQNKLTVSAPHDGAEHEADRAADAMVGGSAFSISAAPTVVARDNLPTYEINDGNYQTVQEGGDSAEKDAQKQNQVLEGTTAYLGASNQDDRAQADRLLKAVTEGMSELATARQDDINSDIGGMRGQNEAAKAGLEAYLNASKTQDAMGTQFEMELQKSNVQYAKLDGMYKTALASLGVKEGSTEFDAGRANDIAKGGKEMYDMDAQNAAKNQGVYTGKGTEAEKARKNIEISSAIANLSRISADLGKLPPQMGEAARDLKLCHGRVNTALQTCNLPPPALQMTDEQKKDQAAIAEAKAQFDQAVAIINTASSVAASQLGNISLGGTDAGPVKVGDPGTSPGTIDGGHSGLRGPTEVPGGTNVNMPSTKGSAGDVAKAKAILDATQKGDSFLKDMGAQKFSFVEGLADSLTQYTTKVNSAQKHIDAITDANTKATITNAKNILTNEKTALQNVLTKLRTIRTQMELGKGLLRSEADRLMTLIDGNKSKDGSGPDYGTIVAFQTEATIFVTQVDSTIAVGEVEREAAKEINPHVKEGPSTANPDAPAAGSKGITNSKNYGSPYWTAYKMPRPDKPDKNFWTYTRNTVAIQEKGNGSGGQRVLDTKMDEMMGLLRKDKATVEGFVATLKKYSGI